MMINIDVEPEMVLVETVAWEGGKMKRKEPKGGAKLRKRRDHANRKEELYEGRSTIS